MADYQLFCSTRRIILRSLSPTFSLSSITSSPSSSSSASSSSSSTSVVSIEAVSVDSEDSDSCGEVLNDEDVDEHLKETLCMSSTSGQGDIITNIDHSLQIDRSSSSDTSHKQEESMTYTLSLPSSSSHTKSSKQQLQHLGQKHQSSQNSQQLQSHQQQQHHHQQQLHLHQQHYDVEEATPPASSQRPDPSRRRNPNVSVLEEPSATQADDELKAIVNLPKAPSSNNNTRTLPMGSITSQLSSSTSNLATTISTVTKKGAEPRLIHPLLNRCPLQFRFAFNGVLSNILFMIVYNNSVHIFVQYAPASTIYSIVYLFFIPFGHFTANLLVFGWPEHYLQSLASNFPIGLTAIAIGSALTAYLDRIHFNHSIEEYVYENWTFRKMPDQRQEFLSEKSEFYSSLVVLFVTSVWTYVLSIWINSPPMKSDKKEL